MRTRARNQFEGEVISVKKGVVGAIVKVKVSGPVVVTAFITKDSVEELEIKKGDRTTAIVKSTEVMVAKEV